MPKKAALLDGFDALRDRGERPNLADVTAIARRRGLRANDALRIVRKFVGGSEPPSSEIAAALEGFVASFCSTNQGTRFLEYTSSPCVLGASLLERHKANKARIVVPDAELAEFLSEFLGDGTIAQAVDNIGSQEVFDNVVCQAPLGYRSREKNADGFGGEIVRSLAPFVSVSGRFIWVTERSVLSAASAKKTFAYLTKERLHASAAVDIPAGGFPGLTTKGSLLVFERDQPAKRFVGVLRDPTLAADMATAVLNGPTRKRGPCWGWIDIDDTRTYGEIEQAELVRKLTPRGSSRVVELGALILGDSIRKADKPIPENSEATGFLYVPEYAGSRVTIDKDESTVKPRAIHRVPIDTSNANPRFLAALLNSSYGRELRASAAKGATIKRISATNLRSLRFPLPELSTQNQIARIGSDLALLSANFDQLQEEVDRDWTAVQEISEKVNDLKSVLDIEQRVKNWWRELPYPLATIYRRYQVATEPKDRLDRLLHFFEMAAIYLAAIGTSHVKELRPDWQQHLAKWFHPTGYAGIERTSFGFWTTLARTSLKDLRRIGSTEKLRTAAEDKSGNEMVEVASNIGLLGKAVGVLDTVRGYRNTWKGHGGYLKESDAKRHDRELQQSIDNFYEATAGAFKRLLLVRTGSAEVNDGVMTYHVDILAGSDPAFEAGTAKLSHTVNSRTLAFWTRGAGVMCQALPLFRLGVPQRPQETDFYVFNRVEPNGFRWISYHDADEQDFVDSDEELNNLIRRLQEVE